jgi:hypothetical protein
MLLLSVLSISRNEAEFFFLNEAIIGAFSLGMYQVQFVPQYGQGGPALEESWTCTL